MENTIGPRGAPSPSWTSRSNVFGKIAADNLGYARVVLDQTTTRAAGGCRVTVHLAPAGDAPAPLGREYFKS